MSIVDAFLGRSAPAQQQAPVQTFSMDKPILSRGVLDILTDITVGIADKAGGLVMGAVEGAGNAISGQLAMVGDSISTSLGGFFQAKADSAPSQAVQAPPVQEVAMNVQACHFDPGDLGTLSCSLPKNVTAKIGQGVSL